MNVRQLIKQVLLYPGFEPISDVGVMPVRNLIRLGSAYGGWIIPGSLLPDNPICYCIGAGEDITFDLELIRRFGAQVFCYDPTPRAAIHVTTATKGIEQYHFFAAGIWSENKQMKFFAPADPAHVSHSIVNLQKTDQYFEANCKTLSTAMRESGHTSIDLLKMDVEGAEYNILQSLIRDQLQIRILCVEFDEIHHPLDHEYRMRIRRAIHDLSAHGFTLVSVEGCNYTFLENRSIPWDAHVAHWIWRKLRPVR